MRAWVLLVSALCLSGCVADGLQIPGEPNVKHDVQRGLNETSVPQPVAPTIPDPVEPDLKQESSPDLASATDLSFVWESRYRESDAGTDL